MAITRILKNLSRTICLMAVVCASLFLMSPEVFAQSLQDLRMSGQVGEAFDGYARARDNNVKAAVDAINAKRRSIYTSRANEQGISADQVGKVYADKIKAKAPSGTWLMSPNGSWRQK